MPESIAPSLHKLMSYWVSIPEPVRLALWVGLGIALSAALWRMLPSGKARKIAPVAFLALYLIYPDARAWIKGALNDYRVQKEAWLAAKCQEIAGPVTTSSAKPAQVEGFLIAVDYDKLVNERFQRIGRMIQARDGTTSVDMGGYGHHPVHRALSGDTFAKKADVLLREKRFSYVEFEMVPEDSGKSYSNAGNLNTTGWSGKRYRLYYLAPGDHRGCVSEAGEVPQASGSAVLGGLYENLAKQGRPQQKAMCLALEVTDAPISRHRIEADEPIERMRWQARIRGINVPVWTTVRGDRIRVTDDKGELDRYFGFDYPNELSTRHRCNNPQRAASMIGNALAPDVSRAFYRGKSWYQGSATQRFYEPKVQVVTTESKPAASVPAGECPRRTPGANAKVVANQLEDFTSRRQTNVESVVGGTQPASFFSLSRSSSISMLAWSGMLNRAAETEKFLVRIFRDADGLPGALAQEFEITARRRSTGTWNVGGSIFEARPEKLSLPAGDYWLSILSPNAAQSNFFWAFEPEGERPECGSGGVTRHYDGGKWGGGGGAPAGLGSLSLTAPAAPVARPRIVQRNARGFSFRMEATN